MDNSKKPSSFPFKQQEARFSQFSQEQLQNEFKIIQGPFGVSRCWQFPPNPHSSSATPESQLALKLNKKQNQINNNPCLNETTFIATPENITNIAMQHEPFILTMHFYDPSSVCKQYLFIDDFLSHIQASISISKDRLPTTISHQHQQQPAGSYLVTVCVACFMHTKCDATHLFRLFWLLNRIANQTSITFAAITVYTIWCSSSILVIYRTMEEKLLL